MGGFFLERSADELVELGQMLSCLRRWRLCIYRHLKGFGYETANSEFTIRTGMHSDNFPSLCDP